MQQFMDSWLTALSTIAQHVLPIVQQLYDAVYEQYKVVGAPYGETQDGCLRWMEEIAEIKRMEEEIDRMVSHHQGLAYLRKRIAEKYRTNLA